jgi:hypothetical protein
MSSLKSITIAFTLMCGIMAWASNPAVAGPACTCAGNVSDNFDDGIMTWVPSVNCGISTEFAGTLRLVKGGGCNGLTSARLEPPVCGDFDAQMDYTLLNFGSLAAGSRFTGIRVTTLGGALVAGIDRTASTNTGGCELPSAYKAYAADSSACAAAWAATGDNSGKLRITRQGVTLRTYYWDGTAWVPMLSANVTSSSVYFDAFVNSDGDTQAFAVSYDNFVLTSESCPTPAQAASWGTIKATYR